MTPDEFELRQERAEDAYLSGDMGRIAFMRRMSSLGFKTEAIKEWLKELDQKRLAKG